MFLADFASECCLAIGGFLIFLAEHVLHLTD
jgi:hypothetical protein